MRLTLTTGKEIIIQAVQVKTLERVNAHETIIHTKDGKKFSVTETMEIIALEFCRDLAGGAA